MTSPGTIVFQASANPSASVRRGFKRQEFVFVDIIKGTGNTIILPLGTDSERMFFLATTGSVTVTARTQGSTGPFTSITSTAVGLPFRGALVAPRFYLIYATTSLEVRTSASTIIQSYQVSMILPMVIGPGSKQGGYVSERLGSITTGGPDDPVNAVASLFGSVTVTGAPGDLLVVTARNGSFGTFLIGQGSIGYNVVSGLVFDLVQPVIISSSFFGSLDYVIYRPVRTVGQIPVPPSSTVGAFIRNDSMYRLGSSYIGDQKVAKTVTIQGVTYLVAPPGAGI